MRCSTDHHNIAFAKSSHKGFHHASYEVGSFDEVGMGGMWMREQGWEPAWGLGRHAIGSNVFYYIKDPLGQLRRVLPRHRLHPRGLGVASPRVGPQVRAVLLGPDVPRDFIENKQDPTA